MQKLESLLIALRESSPTGRIAATVSPEVDRVTYHALTVCEHCGGEIAVGDGFAWQEWGWYRGDYRRAEAYADATRYAHHAQEMCKRFSFE